MKATKSKPKVKTPKAQAKEKPLKASKPAAKLAPTKPKPKPKPKPKGKRMTGKVTDLRVVNITVDAAIQPRANSLDQAHVAELEDSIKRGVKLPAVVVYRTKGGEHVLSEGFHRYEAYKRSGKTHITTEVRTGELTDAALNAMSSNQGHGLKRTNNDKRRAVEEVLKLCPNWSDRRIADHVGVSGSFVGDIRPQVQSDCTSTDRDGKDGKTYKKPEQKPTPEVKAKSTPSKPKDDKPDWIGQDSTSDETPTLVRATCLECSGSGLGAGGVSCEVCGGEGYEVVGLPGAEKPHVEEPAETLAVALDQLGLPIQPHAAEAFEAVPLFKELAGLLRQARAMVTQIGEQKGGALLQARMQWVKGDNRLGGRWSLADLDNVLGLIDETTPQVTDCPYAHNPDAPHPDKCPVCRGKRFAGKLKYFQVPQDLIDAMVANLTPAGE